MASRSTPIASLPHGYLPGEQRPGRCRPSEPARVRRLQVSGPRNLTLLSHRKALATMLRHFRFCVRSSRNRRHRFPRYLRHPRDLRYRKVRPAPPSLFFHRRAASRPREYKCSDIPSRCVLHFRTASRHDLDSQTAARCPLALRNGRFRQVRGERNGGHGGCAEHPARAARPSA